MSAITLPAEVRSVKGKGASRRLRRLEEKVPAIVYGASIEPQMLSLPENIIRKAMESEAFFSQIIDLDIAGKKQQVVLRDVQRHPSKARVLHLDFLAVTGKETITMRVPLHFLNEENAVGVKKGGLVSHTLTEIEIKCLPKDLPEFIEVDIADLELDAAIHLTDVKLPSGVEHAGGEIDPDHDDAVVSIHTPKRAVIEEEGGEEAAASDSGADKGEGENKA